MIWILYFLRYNRGLVQSRIKKTMYVGMLKVYKQKREMTLPNLILNG